MKKIYNKQQLMSMKAYPAEVAVAIKKTIQVLDENYGEDRDIEANLGGYVLIVETAEDIKELKEKILKGVISEYTDEIKCSEGVNWTSSLFLLSNDFAIVVIADKGLFKFLLE